MEISHLENEGAKLRIIYNFSKIFTTLDLVLWCLFIFCVSGDKKKSVPVSDTL